MSTSDVPGLSRTAPVGGRPSRWTTGTPIAATSAAGRPLPWGTGHRCGWYRRGR